MKTRAVYITSVIGDVPILHVPKSWRENQIIALIRAGFGTQRDGKDHAYTKKGEEAALKAYRTYMVAQLFDRMGKLPQALSILRYLVKQKANLSDLVLLLQYDVTPEEFEKLFDVIQSMGEAFEAVLKDKESMLSYLWMVRWRL